MDVTALCGYRPDPVANARIIASLPHPIFAQAAPELMGGTQTDVFLYKAWKDATGGYPHYVAQQIGDCTSFGSGHAVDLLQAVQIAIGKMAQEWKETCTEALYGAGREIANMLGSGDGCYGGAMAKAVSTVGIIPRSEVGAYSGQRAKQWGNTGTPADVKTKMGQHKVKTTSLVQTWDELFAALSNGYPVIVCSNQGFQLTRNDKGIAEAQGSWPHCVLPDTLISGRKTKRAADIRVGDEVVGHDGKHHKVTEIFEREYNHYLVSLKACGLPPVKVTSEHPMLVYRKMHHSVNILPGADLSKGSAKYQYLEKQVIEWETEQPCWVRAKDIQEGDYLITPMWEMDEKREVPAWNASSRKTKYNPLPLDPSDPDLAWLFGLYIADGYRSKSHRIVITLSSKETDTIVRAQKTFQKYGLNCKVIDKGTYVRVMVNSSIVANSFGEWFGTSSLTKRIPDFMFSKEWNLEALMEGIIDGDGCTHQGRNNVTSTSKVLISQMYQVLVSLGEEPVVSAQKRGPGCYNNANPAWVIEWGERKRHETRKWNNLYLSPVKSITREDYNGYVYNYEVEDVHSYIADGVVAHNCMMISGIMYTGTSDECAVICNSWGDTACTGPTPNDMPPFAFGARRRVVEGMLAGQDSFAFSSFDGYPGQPLPGNWTVGGWGGFDKD